MFLEGAARLVNKGLIAGGAGGAGGHGARSSGEAGQAGAAIYAFVSSAATVVNYGELKGGVVFNSASDRLVAEAGSYAAACRGGGGSLELASGQGTIQGLGAGGSVTGAEEVGFSDFGSYLFDGGTSWTLVGADTIGPSRTQTNDGTLLDAGTLLNLGLVNGSAGVTLVGQGLVINRAAANTTATIGSLYAAAQSAATVTNFGVIEGSVTFLSSADRLITEVGSTIVAPPMAVAGRWSWPVGRERSAAWAGREPSAGRKDQLQRLRPLCGRLGRELHLGGREHAWSKSGRLQLRDIARLADVRLGDRSSGAGRGLGHRHGGGWRRHAAAGWRTGGSQDRRERRRDRLRQGQLLRLRNLCDRRGRELANRRLRTRERPARCLARQPEHRSRGGAERWPDRGAARRAGGHHQRDDRRRRNDRSPAHVHRLHQDFSSERRNSGDWRRGEGSLGRSGRSPRRADEPGFASRARSTWPVKQPPPWPARSTLPAS